MDKLLWVLMPILLAGAAVGVLAWRGRLPPRPVLNVAFSLLLLVYLLVTAGLGIFWVANQHLPVFDWHYVFGYALLLLVAVHLAFNLRAVLLHLRRRPAAAATAAGSRAGGRRPVLGTLGLLGVASAAGVGYFVGLRHGRTELRIEAGSGPAQGPAADARARKAQAVVERFHDFSSHTRSGVLRRAPGADWGDPPPPFKPAGTGLRLPLPGPPPGRDTHGPRPAAGGLDLSALATLLWHTAGVSARSGGLHFRTSPSSGALFATELYVLALDIPGVPIGLWHYDVPGAALQAVAPLAPAGTASAPTAGTREDSSTGPWPGIGVLPAGSQALIVATALFRRSGHKYRDRTYRYVLGDLGHALENLRVVAQHAGARATLLQAFDEARIAAALGIDEAEEGVLALMLLQGADAPPLPALDASRWQPPVLAEGADSQTATQTATPGKASGAKPGTTLGITDAIYRATSLRAAALSAVGYTAPESVATPGAPGATAASLAPSASTQEPATPSSTRSAASG